MWVVLPLLLISFAHLHTLILSDPTSSIPQFPQANETLIPINKYELVFWDDFNGSAIDSSCWTVQNQTKAYGPVQANLAKPENVLVKDGLLHLINRRVNLVDINGIAVNYTCGRINTKPNYRFKYGFFAARIRSTTASGWHTSFWLRNVEGAIAPSNDEEIDIVETDSVSPLRYSSTLWKWKPAANATTLTTPVFTHDTTCGDLTQEYHVLACEWTESVINFYCNGNLVYRGVVPTNTQFNPANVLLTTLALSWNPSVHPIDEMALPGESVVDWVAVYQVRRRVVSAVVEGGEDGGSGGGSGLAVLGMFGIVAVVVVIVIFLIVVIRVRGGGQFPFLKGREEIV
eukprot:TRINITY_DN2408_c0_g1_i1.p1 TRINITY_DN2408_c0_g1~~TRINITY_DN2408_c0_g1_i1.p1  ORF type:complete len:344 (-),score=68.55 TRINITY_DN2408_c0_g1_i1:68-1099(-)